MQYLGSISKTTEWSQFASKQTVLHQVIQVYAPITNAEIEWFYEDLQDLLELTKKDVLFIIGD